MKITLKEHFEKLLEEQDKRHELAFRLNKEATALALSAAKEAVSVAETNSEKWRANSNEWRAAMTDRERNFMPRAEAEALGKALAEKIQALTGRQDTIAGRSDGANWLWTTAASVIGLIIGGITVALMLKH